MGELGHVRLRVAVPMRRPRPKARKPAKPDKKLSRSAKVLTKGVRGQGA